MTDDDDRPESGRIGRPSEKRGKPTRADQAPKTPDPKPSKDK